MPRTTLHLISRAGIVTWCLISLVKTTCTRVKYLVTVSLIPILSNSNSRFPLPYAASRVSATVFVSARHASEGNPIPITISSSPLLLYEPSTLPMPEMTQLLACYHAVFQVQLLLQNLGQYRIGLDMPRFGISRIYPNDLDLSTLGWWNSWTYPY